MKFYQWCVKETTRATWARAAESGAKLDISAVIEVIYAKKKSNFSEVVFQNFVGYCLTIQ
jgi:hypothetical protein